MFEISTIRRQLLVRCVAWSFLALLGGCDSFTGPGVEGTPNVSVAFGVAGESSAASAPSYYQGAAVSGASTAGVSSSEGSLRVTGTNGTLEIDDVRLILASFQLRPTADGCLGDDAEVACHRFDAPPQFIRLPLAGESELALAEDVPSGSYRALRFRVENLDLGDVAADVTAQDLAELFGEISAEFPDWPAGASMMVSGSFTPTGSTDAMPFDVFFDAEIEVVKVFEPPLEVGGGDLTVTVDVDLARWFADAEGAVRNLAEVDYARTGELVEFHADVVRGFADHHVDDGQHEEAETTRFHGSVASVDVEGRSLELEGGSVVRLDARTELVSGDPGLLSSLSAAAEAMSSGLAVAAVGRGVITSTGIVAREMALSLERAEFEGRVASVDLEAGAFVVVREEVETVVRVTDATDIRGVDLPGRLESLAAVQEALAAGSLVRAHGWGVVEGSQPRTLHGVVVTFPLVGEGFESRVAAVDLEHRTLTLHSGTVVRVGAAAEVRHALAFGHLADLESVATAVAEGSVVVAFGEGFVVGLEPLKIEAVWGSFRYTLEDFEAQVAAVDLDAGSFTLHSGWVVAMADRTEISDPDGPSRLATLAEVKGALDAGGVVVSFGDGFVIHTEPVRLRARVVGFLEQQ